jgi:hypothetical protein
MILRIDEARVCGPHSLQLTFNDGTTKQVNVRPLLEGPIFEPLRDPAYFARMTLDSTCGTVVWPNGADFAPEALHELEAERDTSAIRAPTFSRVAPPKRRSAPQGE